MATDRTIEQFFAFGVTGNRESELAPPRGKFGLYAGFPLRF